MIVNSTLAQVRIRVIEDDSGRKRELVGILGEDGVIQLLLSYLVERQSDGFSLSSISRTVLSVKRFLEYLGANKNGLKNPKLLFQSFVRCSYEGTIGEDGIDPLGLYWVPVTAQTTRHSLRALKNLLEWIIERESLTSSSILRPDASPDETLRYAAWFTENQYDFLTRTKVGRRNGKRGEFKSIRGRRPTIHRSSDPLEFPEQAFRTFFENGIGISTDFRSALRDKLIILLLHGGGLRESEALSLWTTDVFLDPQDPECALVRIYHPEDGRAPENWRGRNGQTNRAAYLLEKFGLTPRNKLIGSLHLGWKNSKVDGRDNFIQVQWFPKDYGRLFLRLWQDYMRVLATVTRHHPYAFIAFRKQNFGAAYTRCCFHQNYARGLKRIGRTQNSAEGYSPHGHRHSYARRLVRAGVDPIIRQKCLHHSSITSQDVYTSPTLADVSRTLEDAMENIDPKTGCPML